MTTKEINKSIDLRKIQMTKGEKMEYWINFILLFIPFSFFGFVIIYDAVEYKEFSIFGLILVGMLILFIKYILVSPKLEVYNSNLTEEQFKTANLAAAKLNDWIVVSNTKNYFSAIKSTNWQWEGIKITAILQNGKFYLNRYLSSFFRKTKDTLPSLNFN